MSLRSSLVYLLTAATFAALGCKFLPGSKEESLEGHLPVSDTQILTANLMQLHDLLTNKVISAEQLTAFYMRRIQTLNVAGPNLKAVIATNPDAMIQARVLDGARHDGDKLPPLWGIPVLIKDNIETKDELATTAGSLALKDNVTHRDAPVVTNLRMRGAIILGKANMSEWAGMRGKAGWSAVGGQVINPYDPGASPCGSSAGSAVAVAAGLAPIAVGTETSGSIICPAGANDVVGIKPTAGLLRSEKIIPITERQDTPGAIAKSVADGVTLLDALAARDEHESFQNDLYPNGLKDMVVGYANVPDPDTTPVTTALFQTALDDVKRAGAKTVAVDLSGVRADKCDILTILLAEMHRDLGQYLQGVEKNLPAHSLEELVAFNARTPAEIVSDDRDQMLAALKIDSNSAAYQDAMGVCYVQASNYGKVMDDNKIDVLVAPTTSLYTVLSAFAGNPHLTVPMGFVDGKRPLGLTFFGRHNQESIIIKAAYAFEIATQARHRRWPPTH